MSTHITKTWFDGEKVVTQEISESDFYTTQQSEANQVPLVELLSAVPADIRIGVDDGNDWKAGTTWHPVGQLCHEAAVELRRLHEDNEMLLAHKDGDIEDFKRLLNRITMLEVALRRAVNALENTTPTGFNMESDKKFYEAITTAKQALEQT